MKAGVFGLFASVMLAAAGYAQTQEAPVALPQSDPCEIPGYILFGDGKLDRLKKTVEEHKRMNILVLGTGSSVLPGPDGAARSYPGRLEERLRKRFPHLTVKVTAVAKSRLTATDMVENLEKALLDQKPDLVVWQTGTVDAIRGIDPERFRVTLDEGVDLIEESGADLILMNMQYSPRTETMISLGQYADIMRVVARDRSVPLFDRREIMRYWNDNGNFDLNLGGKDIATAYKVHDCLGRALASLIVEAAHLDAIKPGATQ